MKQEMKLKAVIDLMNSLEFTQKEKQALLEYLQGKNAEVQAENEAEADNVGADEYGEPKPFLLFFEDGLTGYHLRRNTKCVGIVIDNGRRRFVLNISNRLSNDFCINAAKREVNCIPSINGRSWRLLTDDDCRAIKPQRDSINNLLSSLGCRTISRCVLSTTPRSMDGATTWQVWAVMDL